MTKGKENPHQGKNTVQGSEAQIPGRGVKVVCRTWVKGWGWRVGEEATQVRRCQITKGLVCQTKKTELDHEVRQTLWRVLKQGVVWMNKPVMGWGYQGGLPGGGQT
jgi:hypothetical protein|uniref:PRO1995 n=1 Tax=Homo sapiens TaxID=9606 RepID=Q9P1F7_HUMAN|nr:PRO1995 [Homo sapiens]